MASDKGYIDYFAILGVNPEARPGEVRNIYKQKMKALMNEIANAEITEQRRSHFLLEMAKLNAAVVLLRDTETRAAYWTEREALVDLEQDWREAVEAKASDADALRREYDRKLRDFLARYVEELMLVAGRDKECVEASNWDENHERHASTLLRRYRHMLYQDVLERLPYFDVTPPRLDWDERRATVAKMLSAGGR